MRLWRRINVIPSERESAEMDKVCPEEKQFPDRLSLVLFILFFLVAGLASGAQPSMEKVDVFPAGMHGVTLYRIPGIVVTPKGTVLAYCEARRDSRADWGEIEVHLRRSKDGGKTWLPVQQIAHHGQRDEGNPRKKTGGEKEQTVNNPVAIVDYQTGAIEFLYCLNYARCFSIRSVDDGETWSKPIEITKTFEPFRQQYPWKVIATGPGHGTQLKTGRLIVPVWLAYGETGDHSPSSCGTIYSDDHGKSWKAGEIAVPNQGDFNNPNETMLTTTEEGSVMLVTRSVSKPNRKIVTTSPSGIGNWSTPRFHPQLLEPVCMASILRVPKSGDRDGCLLFTNPNQVARDKSGDEIPAGRGKRRNLTVKLSRDDGESWAVSKTIEAGPSAYSDLALLPDGTILCLYEGEQTIACARFNLEWIDSP